MLVATAGFGGLDTAPPDIEELSVGEEYINEQASIAIERFAMVDSFEDQQGYAMPGEKYAILVTIITNNTAEPLPALTGAGTFGSEGFKDNLSVTIQPTVSGPPTDAQQGELPDAIVLSSDEVYSALLTDDGSPSTYLQPGVPTRVAYVWFVQPDKQAAIRDSGEVSVTIYDLSYGRHSIISEEDTWDEPEEAARVQLVPEIRGAVPSITNFDGPAAG